MRVSALKEELNGYCINDMLVAECGDKVDALEALVAKELKTDDPEAKEGQFPCRKSASNVVSRHRRASSPSSDEVGGLFSDFEPFPVISSRRVGERARAVAAMASSRPRRRDAVDVIT